MSLRETNLENAVICRAYNASKSLYNFIIINNDYKIHFIMWWFFGRNKYSSILFFKTCIARQPHSRKWRQSEAYHTYCYIENNMTVAKNEKKIQVIWWGGRIYPIYYPFVNLLDESIGDFNKLWAEQDTFSLSKLPSYSMYPITVVHL